LLILALPWSIAAMSITSVACAVLTASLWLLRPPPRWPSTRIGRPALAWCFALILSAVFALDPTASFGRLGKVLFPWLVPLAAFHNQDRHSLRNALTALLVSSAGAALVGTIIFLAHGAWYPSRARGPSGHYMTYGGQLLLGVSVAFGVAILARDKGWRRGALLALGVGLLALALTFTRSAWIGAGVSFAVVLAFVRPRWIPAFAVLVAVLYFVAPASFRDRMHSAFDPHNAVNRERTFMWDAGMRMFRDHPITGVGLQDLHAVYDRYRSPESNERAGHLHSVPVQIAATMGLVGLIAFLWLYGSLIRGSVEGLRRDLAAGGVEAGLRLGVLGALIGFLVSGLFEWNFGDEELLYFLFTIAGLAWAARGLAAPQHGGAPAPPAGART
jgi:O-antigen ligase